MRRRAAFTIIELLIAIALGAAICAASAVAVRAAAQCVAQANRLSLQNQLFRAGLAAGLEDLDTWASLDDPNDDTRQPLRLPSRAEANPFRPYADGADFAFRHSDPRDWWRGAAMALRPYGDYALASRIGFSDVDGVADPVRASYPERLEKVARTLGYYALLDYFPASAVFQYYAADGSLPAEFSIDSHVGDPTADPRFYLAPWFAGTREPGTAPRLLHCFAYAVTTSPPWADCAARAGFTDAGGAWSTTAMHQQTGQRLGVMPVAPAHWPRMSVETRRFFYCGHAVSFASVVMRDPATGSLAKLQLTALATTLRGARQQRGLDRHAPAAP